MAAFLTGALENAKNDLEAADKELATTVVNESDPAYRQLKRNAKAKEEIYISLLKEAEQSKIRQTVESMDLQVVTPANLPEAPMPSKTKLYMVVGIKITVLRLLIETICFFSLYLTVIFFTQRDMVLKCYVVLVKKIRSNNGE